MTHVHVLLASVKTLNYDKGLDTQINATSKRRRLFIKGKYYYLIPTFPINGIREECNKEARRKGKDTLLLTAAVMVGDLLRDTTDIVVGNLTISVSF